MLRKTFTQICLLVMLVAGASVPGFAQNCTPDSTMTNSTNYPKTWKTGCVGIPYEETIYFAFPKDTNVVVNITFTSYEVVNTTNMPAWMTYDCNVSGCRWTPTNTQTSANHIFGCLTVSGTPTAPFSGTIDIDIEGCGDTFIGNQCGNDIQTFNLTVVDTAQVAFTSTVNQQTVDFTDATIGGATALSYNWTFGDGNASSVASPTHTYAALGTYNVCYTRTDGCGNYQTCKDVVIDVASLDVAGELAEWTISPNPATNQMWIEGDLLTRETVELNLLTLHGKQIWGASNSTNDLHFKAPVDLQGLAAGVYLMEIRAGENRVVKRIQKL